ncbi:MAG: efflux RND transporter periplasmic adaptor subunit [Burkholderiaceae bacterium]
MNRRTLFAVVALVAVGSVAAAVALRRPATPAARPVTAAPTVEFLADELWTAQPLAIERTLPLTGTLKAANQTIVKTKVAGDLVRLAVREGESVRAGQLVARIDPTEYEWRVKREQAALAAAQAQLDIAVKTRENSAQLLAKGFISQTAFDSAQSALEAARGNRDAAAAALELARKALADTEIRAPIAGTVAERFAQPGEKLPVDGRVLSLVDLSSIELEAPIPAGDVAQVAVGTPAEFRPEGIERTYTGKVVRINPATAPGSRSVYVYIAVERADPALRAGMFANGRLVLGRSAPVLAVPFSAVREEAGRAAVLAVVDGKLAQVAVTLGARGGAEGLDDAVEIRSGLAAGTQVVRQFDARLPIGGAVKVAQAPAPAAAAR